MISCILCVEWADLFTDFYGDEDYPEDPERLPVKSMYEIDDIEDVSERRDN